MLFVSRTYLLVLVLLFLLSTMALAQPTFIAQSAPAVVSVSTDENGNKRTGQQLVWHDEQGNATAEQAIQAYHDGLFSPLQSAGSTGLNPGAFWTVFRLQNQSPQPNTLHLEYVDHQLIQMDAYYLDLNKRRIETVASLSMEAPFQSRIVDHPRLVLPVDLAGNGTQSFLVRMNSHEVGYVFPSMRIWSPDRLARAILVETALVSFLFGGFFLMIIFAVVAGIASGKSIFYMYSVYAFGKIAVWMTILGFTHQYVITENFKWHYMSISGAFVIVCGFVFARMFLETKKFTPVFDKLFLLSIANGLLLFTGAVMQWKLLAIVTITIALLMYPIIVLAGFLRWRQGSLESGIFTLAWLSLVIGLVIQAGRDLGLVEHNFVNYYWPPVASFIELLAIMAALGMQVNRLRKQKVQAEQAYKRHLEQSQYTLEKLVKERTHALSQEKIKAELEAHTDHLTSIANRRSFFSQLEERIAHTKQEGIPLSLLIFDLDNFKNVNDKYGHHIGDKALKSFCNTVSGKLRSHDVFGRLGGEEFGLVVNETLGGAQAIAERLCEEVATSSIPTKNERLNLSVSIGVSQLIADDTLELLFSRADKALYQAKSNGRNRVEVS